MYYLLLYRLAHQTHTTMIKTVCESYNDREDEDEMRLKRDYHVVEIRKNKREKEFKRRRNQMQGVLLEKERLREKMASQPGRRKIVDPNLAPQLQTMMNEKFTVGMLPELSNLLQSEDIMDIHRGLFGIHSLLCLKDSPTGEILFLQIEDKLIQFASDTQFPQIQLQTSYALAYLALGSPEQCMMLMRKGLLDVLFTFLTCKDLEIVEQGIWGIGNLTCDCKPQILGRVLMQRGIKKIIAALDNFEDRHLIQEGCQIIATLCMYFPTSHYELMEQGVLYLCCNVQSGCIIDEIILEDCLWGIARHCESREIDKGEIIRKSNLIPKIIPHLLGKKIGLQLSALHVIGNYSLSNEGISSLFEHNILGAIYRLLFSSDRILRRDACWALSNITAGLERHKMAVIRYEQLIEKLLLMLECEGLSIRKETIFVFANMCYNCGDFEIERYYVDKGIMDSLVDLLDSGDGNVIMAVLLNLGRILQQARSRNKALIIKDYLFKNGGTRVLENLQTTESYEIYREINKIFKKYFEYDEVDCL